jgi:hypothetical protein
MLGILFVACEVQWTDAGNGKQKERLMPTAIAAA